MSLRVTGLFTQQWSRRSVAVLCVLVVCTPFFVWATEQTGYTEPLDVAAGLTGASQSATVVHAGLIPDYTVVGMGTYTGTLAAALVGTGLTLGVAVALGTLLGE